jgi:hypothetical protein
MRKSSESNNSLNEPRHALQSVKRTLMVKIVKLLELLWQGGDEQ